MGETCFFCRKENSIDYLFIVADYKQKEVEKTIQAFKYKFISDLAAPLSQLAIKYLKSSFRKKAVPIFEQSPVLVPVPLHKRRENWRGFNQAAMLAEEIGKSLLLEVSVQALEKRKPTAAQAEIEDKEIRLSNLGGAFISSRRLEGKAILLIDDVCTTGATLNECARVLKQNGAGKVAALVIARG